MKLLRNQGSIHKAASAKFKPGRASFSKRGCLIDYFCIIIPGYCDSNLHLQIVQFVMIIPCSGWAQVLAFLDPSGMVSFIGRSKPGTSYSCGSATGPFWGPCGSGQKKLRLKLPLSSSRPFHLPAKTLLWSAYHLSLIFLNHSTQ